jgi:1-deoxy-D-xylulose-5-phosphate reductoisomerase
MLLIIPIDSEHNAIHQCLGNKKNLKEVSKVVITASGGPFRETPFNELKNVSLQDALNHPTWSMGSKITIDSATLVNKCLELIEANYLFDIPESQIDIVVHPQSIIHSMVTYIDGSTIAQLSNPNMEVPIANALGIEARLPIQFEELNFSELNLSFEPIPVGRERIFEIAREVCNLKGNSGVIMNAANEVAVNAFLDKKILFSEIYDVIERTFAHFQCSKLSTLEDVFDYDKQARIHAEKVIKSVH